VGSAETDADLVIRSQAGDRVAFGVLVGRHQSRVLASCLRLAGNLPDAEELAHESLVQAWLELDQLREPERFAAWARTLTLNVFRMWYRRRRRGEVELPEDLPADEPAPDHGRLEQAISRALLRISPVHRVPLVLHHLEGLSTAEVAAILDVAQGTVLSRLHRGRKAVEELVRGEQEDDVTAPGADMRDDVLAEIEVLIELFRDRPQAAERLSVVLERAPERLAQLLAREGAEDVLPRVGGLLPLLGRAGIRLVLDVRLGPDPAQAGRAGRALEAAAARYRAVSWAGGSDASAEPAAYVLADEIVGHPAQPGQKAELLVALIAAARDPSVSDLLADVLLALGASGVEALLRRAACGAAGELPRPRAVLEALCRTGTPFARLALRDLSPGSDLDVERGLAAAEVLARHLRPGEGSREARALEARHAHRVDTSEVDAAVLEAIRDRVADRLDAPEPHLREGAIRAAAALGDRAWAARIREALSASRLATRLAAIRALAALSDVDSVPRLLELAGEGEREERLGSLEALGHLRPLAFGPARDAVLRLLDDPDEELQAAAVGALAALGGDEVAAVLRRLTAGGSLARRKAALKALHRGAPVQPVPTETTRRLRERLRGPGAHPVAVISIEGTLRFALTELRPYDERDLSKRIARVCEDFASVRRALIELGLMTREAAVYRFTPLGEAVWRTERFVERGSGALQRSIVTATPAPAGT
jgi:RNA polymerase sigma-70 factor (ECF subfamily)